MYIIVYIYISDIHRKSNSLLLVGLILTDLPLPIVGAEKQNLSEHIHQPPATINPWEQISGHLSICPPTNY